jgi:hypothetical protein
MKTFAWRVILLIALTLLIVGCSKEPKQTQPVTTTSQSGTSTAPAASEAEKRDSALVRVINTVPGGKSVDVFADEKKVFEAIAFKAVTGYKELPDYRHTFRVRPTGQDNTQPLTENNEALNGGKHYTIVVMPDTNDKVSLKIFNDNLVPPPADKAEVRVIHASPDAGEVDVVAKQGNKKLFSGVNSGSGTNYTQVDAMSTTLEIRPEGNDNPLVTLTNEKLDKGKIYTIVVAGSTKGTAKLQMITIEDQLGTGATASAGEQKTQPNSKMVKTKGRSY